MRNFPQPDSIQPRLQTQSFAVVITDWQMSRMDGIRLAESLPGQGGNDTDSVTLTVLDDGTSVFREAEAGVRVAPVPTSPQRRHEGG